jgi:hypothetical protein
VVLKRTLIVLAAAAASAALISAAGAAGLPALVTTTSDPFTNASSQHRTAVEPDSYSFGSTIVEVTQLGRFVDGGSSDIGWGTSTDGGSTWNHGTLPGITVYRSGPFDRVSDPSVAYDAEHHLWLVSSLAFDAGPSNAAAVVVSRSTDGIHWSGPVTVATNPGADKNWIVCDTWAHSPHYGHCYVEWDDSNLNDLVEFNVSADGGQTWGPSTPTTDAANGLGGQPLVQPSGRVVVPWLNDPGTAILWTSSTDGGTTWSASKTAAAVHYVTDPGGIRSDPLPSAEIDGGGRVYLVWGDCRFRSGCRENDIVMSTLAPAGANWAAVKRVPIDATSSAVDHLIPGIAADRATAGSGAHLGLAYYFYPNANCTASTCRLQAGFTSSVNGGTTWRAAKYLTPKMPLSWLPNTTLGRMVGDYISTSFAGGKAFPFISVARHPPSAGAFYQMIQTAAQGLAP